MKAQNFLLASCLPVRQFYIIACCLLPIANSFSQPPDWKWAHSAGLTGEDMGNCIAVDGNGYVYATGSYTSATITFGAVTLTNAGAGDFFIVKYDAAGNVIWAKSVGGTGGEIGHGIVVDVNGNAYVTGWFTSPTITFGTTMLTNSGSGNADIFIAKYDSSGNIVWAKSAGGTGVDGCYSIAVDIGGNVYVTGWYSSPSVTLGTITLTNAGGAGTNDILLVKYDVSGNVTWAKSVGGTDNDIGYNTVVDAGGNVYVTGWFYSPSVTFGTSTLSNTGSGADLFLAKYDPSGNVVWANGAGGTGNDGCYGIAVDANNNVYVTGWFNSPGLTFGSTVLTNAGYYDVFLVKYNASGNVLWANSSGGIYDDTGNSVFVDVNGNVYITGRFSSATVDFGSTTLTNVSAGSNDIFIVKYDASGSALWAKSAGGSYDDVGNSIAVDASINVYITGKFNSPTLVFGSTTLYKACNNEFFIAVLSNPVGISENMFSNTLNIYPNPSSGQFTIEIGNWQLAIGNKYSLEIYNVLGEKVYPASIVNPQTSNKIDLSSHPIGVYFVQLTEKGETHAGTGQSYQNKIILLR